MDTWPYQSTFPLAAMPNAPYWARRHIEDVLAKWGCEALAMNAQLVATELVTNAVRYSGGVVSVSALPSEGADPVLTGTVPPAVSKIPENVSLVQLRLSYDGWKLLIEVWDKSEEPPAQRIPDFESEGGRGLFLVNAFCEGMGWYPAFAAGPDGSWRRCGKVVWGEIAISARGGPRPR